MNPFNVPQARPIENFLGDLAHKVKKMVSKHKRATIDKKNQKMFEKIHKIRFTDSNEGCK
jgi:hypothetical protein